MGMIKGPSFCRECRTQIHWVKTPRGKNMPLDMHRVAGGNVEVDENNQAVFVRKDGLPHFISHWATCPDADKFRKKK